MDRRLFLEATAAGLAGAATVLGQQTRSPNDRVTVCVMGVRGRGSSLLSTFASLPDAAKWLLSAGMLFGRLEIFTVLILFLPSFWRN